MNGKTTIARPVSGRYHIGEQVTVTIKGIGGTATCEVVAITSEGIFLAVIVGPVREGIRLHPGEYTIISR